MTKKFVIVELNDVVIYCHGIYDDYFKALGNLVCIMKDSEEEMIKDGYTVIKRDDFFSIVHDAGYGWIREYKREGTSESICKTAHYLLTGEEQLNKGEQK